jgi:hypothetical protein
MNYDSDLESKLSLLYHSLRATRRRYVVQFLKKTDSEKLTTRELARKITSLEEDVLECQATGEPYRNVYNALSQTHLPTLCDAKIIIYDPKRQIIIPDVYFELTALLIDTNATTVNIFSTLTSETQYLTKHPRLAVSAA